MSNPIPEKYQNDIRFDETWEAFICLDCGYAVLHSQLDSHLTHMHLWPARPSNAGVLKWSKPKPEILNAKYRNQLMDAIQNLPKRTHFRPSETLPVESLINRPPDNSPPIEGLKISGIVPKAPSPFTVY